MPETDIRNDIYTLEMCMYLFEKESEDSKNLPKCMKIWHYTKRSKKRLGALATFFFKKGDIIGIYCSISSLKEYWKNDIQTKIRHDAAGPRWKLLNNLGMGLYLTNGDWHSCEKQTF